MDISTKSSDGEAGEPIFRNEEHPRRKICYPSKHFCWLVIGIASSYLITTFTVPSLINSGIIDSKLNTNKDDFEAWTLPEELLHGSLTQINTAIDPCENFYDYACSKGDLSGSTMMAFAYYYVNLLNIFNGAGHSTNLTLQEIDAQTYFESCVYQQSVWVISTSGAKSLINYVDQLGGWSLLPSQPLQVDLDLTRMLQTFHHVHNTRALFSIVPVIDLKNSSQYILTMKTAHQFMYPNPSFYSREDYIDSTVKKNLVRFTVTLFGGKDDYGVRNWWKRLLRFEERLASIIPAIPLSVTNWEASYNPLSLKEIQILVPEISWLNYVKNAVGNSVNITENTTIVVEDLNFLRGLGPILREAWRTTKGKLLLHDYLVWSTVRSVSFETLKPDAQFREMPDSSKSLEIRLQCAIETQTLFASAAASLLKRQSPIIPAAISYVEKMVEEIQDGFKSNLVNLSWVTPELHDHLLQKFSEMIVKIELDMTESTEGMIQERLSRTDYLNNLAKLIQHKRRRQSSYLLKGVTDSELDFETFALSSPAANILSLNRVLIFDKLFQYPLIDVKFPASVNYGRVGFTVGHELMHSVSEKDFYRLYVVNVSALLKPTHFRSQDPFTWCLTFCRKSLAGNHLPGISVDLRGNLVNWTTDPLTLKKFAVVKECLVEQYASYQIPNMLEKGASEKRKAILKEAMFRLDENMADAGGLRAAYSGYKSALKDPLEARKNAAVAVALNMTEDQLFFLALAQTWCTPEKYSEHSRADPHAANEFRVNGPLSNFPAFSEAFQCQLGQNMNRINKCLS